MNGSDVFFFFYATVVFVSNKSLLKDCKVNEKWPFKIGLNPMFLQVKKKDEKKVDLKNNSKNASEKWPFIGHPR